MVDLTGEQAQLLGHLQSQRFVSVLGCAGSGKTTLAVAFAAQLSQAGVRVLLLCRSPFLAEDLTRRRAGSGADVYAFPTFVRALLLNDQSPDVFVPRSPGGWQAPWTQFDAPTGSDLRRALDILQRTDQLYDAVIVDEGQDFETAWLEVAEACLKDSQAARFAIFFDDNPWLAPFSLQRAYADVQAPSALSRNLRSGGEIDGLLSRLHPVRSLTGQPTGLEGKVREWVYTDENELFDSLHQALLAAEEGFPLLDGVVVLTAESASSRLSKFSGLVADSPRLRDSPTQGRLYWQRAVLRYLQGYGLLESSLSNMPAPTAQDMKHVTKFSRAYSAAHRRTLSREPGYLTKYSLAWHMDSFGALRLRYDQADGLELPAADALRYFSSPAWADSLPSAHRRYRLTVDDDWAEYPDYHRLLLVDLPRYKGLEAEGIVLVLYNYFARSEEDFKATLYLACSRARRLLHIVTPFGIL
jgi:energy-coupling factor transporter ATP-binding protein EcfA2